MRIQHNMMAKNSYRHYRKNASSLSKNLEKISSGYKINRAGDDAAGLAISEKMRAQITGLNAAQKNVKDGISLIQTAEGAMQEIHDMLNRLKYLATESSNGTFDDSIDRGAIQDEADALLSEIERIKDTTNFNGIPLLLGEETIIGPQVATYKGSLPGWVNQAQSQSMSGNYTHPINGTQHSAAYVDFSSLTNSNLNDLLGTDVGFYSTCCTCSNHYSIRFTDTTTHGYERSGQHYIFNIGINGVTTGSELVDRIIAGTTTVSSKPGQPLNHFTVFVKDTSKPGQLIMYDERPGQTPNISMNRGLYGQGIAYKYQPSNTTGEDIILQIGDTAEEADQLAVDLPEMTLDAIGITGLDMTTADKALGCIDRIKDGINYVSSERGRMGAYQNRLEHTMDNLSVMEENIQDAESGVRDTDVAEEMMAYTKNNILIQSAQAMLAQANAVPQGVLQLLQ